MLKKSGMFCNVDFDSADIENLKISVNKDDLKNLMVTIYLMLRLYLNFSNIQLNRINILCNSEKLFKSSLIFQIFLIIF
jgi:hypothetical protein